MNAPLETSAPAGAAVRELRAAGLMKRYKARTWI